MPLLLLLNDYHVLRSILLYVCTECLACINNNRAYKGLIYVYCFFQVQISEYDIILHTRVCVCVFTEKKGILTEEFLSLGLDLVIVELKAFLVLLFYVWVVL